MCRTALMMKMCFPTRITVDDDPEEDGAELLEDDAGEEDAADEEL